MSLRQQFTFLCLALLLCAGASISFAQSGTSSIQGIVPDSSGAVVQHATVVLTNTATGVKLDGTSDESGTYSFPSVPPGLKLPLE
jgi:hypothetical protein